MVISDTTGSTTSSGTEPPVAGLVTVFGGVAPVELVLLGGVLAAAGAGTGTGAGVAVLDDDNRDSRGKDGRVVGFTVLHTFGG